MTIAMLQSANVDNSSDPEVVYNEYLTFSTEIIVVSSYSSSVIARRDLNRPYDAWTADCIHTPGCRYIYMATGPLLSTWVYFNPGINTQSHAQLSVRWTYIAIPKLQRVFLWRLGVDK